MMGRHGDAATKAGMLECWKDGNWEPACGTERSGASANNNGSIENHYENNSPHRLLVPTVPLFQYSSLALCYMPDRNEECGLNR